MTRRSMPPMGLDRRTLAGLPLFRGVAARARNTDPDTSQEAATTVERRRKAESHRQQCLTIVRLLPGKTAAEIAHYALMERHEPSRRLPELRDRGLIRTGEKRICTVTGNPSLTWWPAQGTSDGSQTT